MAAEHNPSRPLHADMVIKVCGMREPDNIASVAALAPMLMGFIFHPESPRDASALSPETVKALPPFIRPAGVFVNRGYDSIMATCDRYGMPIAQLHGDETPELCRRLKERGLTVFKAAGIADRTDIDALKLYDGVTDMLVLDTKCEARGGSGHKFDWRLLDGYSLATPYLLSGGIGPADTDAIVAAMRPGMAGIDINSRFETSPGHKDINLLINFILSLRKFNEHEPTPIAFR